MKKPLTKPLIAALSGGIRKKTIKVKLETLDRACRDGSVTDTEFRHLYALLEKFHSTDFGQCHPSDAKLGKAAGGKCAEQLSFFDLILVCLAAIKEGQMPKLDVTSLRRPSRVLRHCIARGACNFLSAFPSRRIAYVALSKHLAKPNALGWFTRFTFESLVDGYVSFAGSKLTPVQITPTYQLLFIDLTKKEYRYWPFDDFPIYEPLLTNYLYTTLRAGDVFFDVGANIGYFSIIAAAIVGQRGKVFAFDANKAMVAQISRSSALNNFQSIVETVYIAFNDGSARTERLFLNPEHTGLASIRPWIGHFESGDLKKDQYVNVPATSFDDWI